MPLNIDIGDAADALTINQLRDALDGTFWSDGWEATTGSGDLEVDIASGEGAYEDSKIETGSTETVDFDGDVDSDDPRKAIVYVDSDENVETAVGDPTPADPDDETRFRTWDPAPPADLDGVVVAEVWLGADASEVTSDDIRDRRVSNAAVESIKNPPITKADEAIDFDEADVSVSNDQTEVSDGSIQLEQNTETLDFSTDSSGGNAGDDQGFVITADVSLEALSVTAPKEQDTITTIRVKDENGDVLEEFDNLSIEGDESYQIVFDFESGKEYQITADADGVLITPSVDTPTDTDYFTLEAGIDDEGNELSDEVFGFDVIEASVPEESGTAKISWPSPEAIESWDIATFQATEDGGTVTVDVLDENDNVEFEDIERNTDISSIDTSENIQIEVELNSDDIENIPTLDYAGRRYER